MPGQQKLDSEPLPRGYGVVPRTVRVVQVVCLQAVARYGSELRWDPKEVGRRDDLQHLLNRKVRSILGALPTTLRGAHMRDSGLTPTPVILDCKQQQFSARLADAYTSELQEVHQKPSSGALR